MDPGTALAVVSLALDAAKELHQYYCAWKGRDGDVAEVRRELLWLTQFFGVMKETLSRKGLGQEHKDIICESVENSQEIIDKLKKKLSKTKKEGSLDTLLNSVQDQGLRALYPFQKGTIFRLLELIENCKKRMHVVIALLTL
jgi:hypothetical protein